MILPRRLMKLEDGKFCEEDDPKQAMNYRPKGYIIPDAQAEREGLIDYLDETGWGETAKKPNERKVTRAQAEKRAEKEDEPDTKAVAQADVEDKAVSPKDAEEKEGAAKKDDAKLKDDEPGPGLHIGAESRPGLHTDPESRRGSPGGKR